MADELRSCTRTGCRWPASASLSYRYATSQVWLLDLTGERDPNVWELCPHHADSLTIPRGWDMVDERSTHPIIHEPAGRDLPGAVAVEEEAPAEEESRYAALSRDLPRLAAELAGSGAGEDVAQSPLPSRELAPGLPPDPPAPESPPAPEPVPALEESGQLAIPAAEGDEGDEAVVVSIELAGARRRPAPR